MTTETTKMVRLTTEAETIAKQYGHTVSAGIVNMSKQIHPVEALLVDNNVNNVNITGKQTVTGSNSQSANQRWLEKSQVAVDGSIRLGDVSEKEYWKKMKIELDAIIQTYAGR